jgi:hypothetical protein
MNTPGIERGADDSAKVLSAMRELREPATATTICGAAKLSVQECLARLGRLAMTGYVVIEVRLPGALYSLTDCNDAAAA